MPSPVSFFIRILWPTHFGKRAYLLRRVNTEIGYAHHTRAETEREQAFGHGWHQRDDALRWSAQIGNAG